MVVNHESREQLVSPVSGLENSLGKMTTIRLLLGIVTGSRRNMKLYLLGVFTV